MLHIAAVHFFLSSRKPVTTFTRLLSTESGEADSTKKVILCVLAIVYVYFYIKKRKIPKYSRLVIML